MKIVVAPDSFKGNLRAEDVCAAIAAGIRDIDPTAEIIELPLADGGEGTARALTLAAGGEFRRVRVALPLGGSVEAVFGLIGGGAVAVLDMASASGIGLVPPGELDPMKASSFGTGELIRAAMDAGAAEIVIGIGGSATVDGGVGMAQALGFDIVDAEGAPVPPGGAGLLRVADIRSANADPRLSGTRFVVACDVTNPLLGENGAARVYGPQKGATPDMIPRLEAGLTRLAEVWRRSGWLETVDEDGDGAAGGLGAALRAFLKAEKRSGAALVMAYAGFARAAAGADLVVTGEGLTDAQTASGKLCSAVAAEARALGVPVALLSGGLDGDVLALLATYDYAASIACGQIGLQAMIRDSPRDLRLAAANLVRAYRAGAAAARRDSDRAAALRAE